jgi:hypothetical protein
MFNLMDVVSCYWSTNTSKIAMKLEERSGEGEFSDGLLYFLATMRNGIYATYKVTINW